MTTNEKILSFITDSYFKVSKENAELAAKLNQEIIKAGFEKTNAFPGFEGQVVVSFYHKYIYAEFILYNNQWEFFLEKDGAEVKNCIYMSFFGCVEKIKELAAEYLK